MYNDRPMRIYIPITALTLLLAACSGDSSVDAPTVSEILPRQARNHVDTRLVIKGKNLLPTRGPGGKQRPTRILLWAGTEERLLRSISLFDVRATSAKALSARLRAGTYPGDYRVVLQTGETTVFTEARLKIVEIPHELGRARVSRVDGRLFSDVPGRVYLSGENLRTATGVSLRSEAGQEVAPLTRLRKYNSARLVVSLGGGLVQPGTYRLAVHNRLGWSQGPKIEVVRSGYGDEANLSFGVYFGVLGAVFVIGCVLAGLQGDLSLRKGAGRRNLLMLLSGFVFTFLLLGSVQFFLAGWS